MEPAGQVRGPRSSHVHPQRTGLLSALDEEGDQEEDDDDD